MEGEVKADVVVENDNEPKVETETQPKLSKNARKKLRRRLAADPNSPTNDDVPSLPKVTPSSSSADTSSSKKSSNTSTKKKVRNKADSKFFGIEPSPIDLQKVSEGVEFLQGLIGLPEIRTPEGVKWNLANVPTTAYVMNDEGKVKEEMRTIGWVLARNSAVLTGGATDRLTDWLDEHPMVAASLSTAVLGWTVKKEVEKVIAAIKEAQAQQEHKTPPREPINNNPNITNENEQIKVEPVKE